MGSLRKKMSGYWRQLSFYQEKSEKLNENDLITKYLEGKIKLNEGPKIYTGKTIGELPNLTLSTYETGFDSIIGCSSGPDGGLNKIQRKQNHLTIPDNFQFIDDDKLLDIDEKPSDIVKSRTNSSISKNSQTNLIKIEEQSLKTDRISEISKRNSSIDSPNSDNTLPPKNFGKDCSKWQQMNDFVYGISDSLYDRKNPTVIKSKKRNGDPIADCYGLITRKDSSIIAVADGVNWGDKASIAAKSAVHGAIYYLNKALFNDTQLFEENFEIIPSSVATSTHDIFVSLLRAFKCAHDLILENEGMLTTLTVSVVLPLKDDKNNEKFVCCVCNVGDSFAYVFSEKYGLRELTKGSHNVDIDRDMRDALGALGPVNGLKPDLTNLTLSMTTLDAGDVLLLASDGLTDNFDPNVCKLTLSLERNFINSSEKQITNHEKQNKIPSTKKVNLEEDNLMDNPLISHFIQKNSCDEMGTNRKNIHIKEQTSTKKESYQGNRNLFRSKTSLDIRNTRKILKNHEGLPYVTPQQRYELQLLLIEEIIRRSVSTQSNEISLKKSKNIVKNLYQYVINVTAPKRNKLEERVSGVTTSTSQVTKRNRKETLELTKNMPGKLDHVTIVACNIGLTL